MSKRIKEMVIGELRNRIGDCRDMLVIDSSRMDAVSDNRFRLALREKDIHVLTVKNALARKALGDDGGTSALDEILSGPSALVWGGEDIVSLSKEISKWARDIKELEIKGGALEGTPLSADDVEALSKSPGREELIGRIVMLALSPGAQLVGALLGPGGTLSGQLKALAEKEGEQESE
jgi:large subunit ribosomal protein L10